MLLSPLLELLSPVDRGSPDQHTLVSLTLTHSTQSKKCQLWLELDKELTVLSQALSPGSILPAIHRSIKWRTLQLGRQPGPMLSLTRVGVRGCSVCLIPHHHVHWPGHISHIFLCGALALIKMTLWSPPANSSVISLMDVFTGPPWAPALCYCRGQKSFRGQGVALNLGYKDSSGEDISNANSWDLGP